MGRSASPAERRSRRVVTAAAAAAVALAGALALHAVLRRVRLRRAAQAARSALARDTYGGYRDADLALRDLVPSGSPRLRLALVRAYALAMLAARYGDARSAAELPALLRPIEVAAARGAALPAGDAARLRAATALAALADRRPGDAIVLLAGLSGSRATAESLLARAEADRALGRIDLAAAAVERARGLAPNRIAVLHLAADLARADGKPGEAIARYRAILAANPKHVPSIVALAELAAEGQAGDRAAAAAAAARVLGLLAGEASPDERCRAVAALAKLDLELGRGLDALGRLRRAGDLPAPPPACAIALARLDRRLGRRSEAVALLREAAGVASGRGDVALALAEIEDDPRAIRELVAAGPPADLDLAAENVWNARAAAAEVRADLALGDRAAALALAPRLDVDCVQGWIGQARLARGAEAADLLRTAARAARGAPHPGDTLADVGEAALSLGLPAEALSACEAAAKAAVDNCRALLCAASALKALGREADARDRLDQALVDNPDVDVPAPLRRLAPAAR